VRAQGGVAVGQGSPFNWRQHRHLQSHQASCRADRHKCWDSLVTAFASSSASAITQVTYLVAPRFRTRSQRTALADFTTRTPGLEVICWVRVSRPYDQLDFSRVDREAGMPGCDGRDRMHHRADDPVQRVAIDGIDPIDEAVVIAVQRPRRHQQRQADRHSAHRIRFVGRSGQPAILVPEVRCGIPGGQKTIMNLEPGIERQRPVCRSAY
jgi:hypothetical protein